MVIIQWKNILLHCRQSKKWKKKKKSCWICSLIQLILQLYIAYVNTRTMICRGQKWSGKGKPYFQRQIKVNVELKWPFEQYLGFHCVSELRDMNYSISSDQTMSNSFTEGKEKEKRKKRKKIIKERKKKSDRKKKKKIEKRNQMGKGKTSTKKVTILIYHS